MTNIAKYKSEISSRSRSSMSKTRKSAKTQKRFKRRMRHTLRRALKNADDESGCQVSGTYWT